MKNDVDGPISRLDITEKRISELDIISIETYKIKKEKAECPRNMRHIQKVYHSCTGDAKRRKKREKKRISEAIMTEFFKLISETKL